MSWLYSRVLVEEFSAGRCSGGELSALWSATPMRRAFLSRGRTTDLFQRFPSGMTLGHLTESLGEGLLTWFQEGFRVRTSVAREGGRESRGSEAGYGGNSQGSLARWDRGTYSWRTAQCLLFEEGCELLETLPSWGMTVAGELWELTMLGHLTGGSESGLWPTVRSSDGERGGRGDLIQAVRGNENNHFKISQTPVEDDAVERKKGKVNSRGEPKLSAQVKMFPTPVAQDDGKSYEAHMAMKATMPGGPRKTCTSLAVMARSGMWPTPNAYDAIPDYGDRRDNNLAEGGRHGVSLRHMAKLWSTPTARDAGSLAHVTRGKASKEAGNEIVEPLPVQVGGSLNPEWVEWLMGWPLGWSGLEPLGTGRFQEWLRLHGGCCQDNEDRRT
jgi:hypothetical protein